MTLVNTFLNQSYCVVDTETGGLEPKQHSLLSIGLVVVKANRIVAEKEILVKILDGYHCTQSAMAINKINLAEHNLLALEPKQVFQELNEFLHTHFDHFPICLAGHNVAFDSAFLKEYFCVNSMGSHYSGLFSHRMLDTSSILRYLQLIGIYKSRKAGLFEALKHFKISFEDNNLHRALEDARLTAKLLIELVNIGRQNVYQLPTIGHHLLIGE